MPERTPKPKSVEDLLAIAMASAETTLPSARHRQASTAVRSNYPQIGASASRPNSSSLDIPHIDTYRQPSFDTAARQREPEPTPVDIPRELDTPNYVPRPKTTESGIILNALMRIDLVTANAERTGMVSRIPMSELPEPAIAYIMREEPKKLRYLYDDAQPTPQAKPVPTARQTFPIEAPQNQAATPRPEKLAKSANWAIRHRKKLAIIALAISPLSFLVGHYTTKADSPMQIPASMAGTYIYNQTMKTPILRDIVSMIEGPLHAWAVNDDQASKEQPAETNEETER